MLLKVIFYTHKKETTREAMLAYSQVEEIGQGKGWLEGEDYCEVFSPMAQTRPVIVKNYVNPEPKHVINTIPVEQLGFEDLLNLFPSFCQDKLRMYTAEELFYVYKLATYKPRLDRRSKVKELAKPSDVLFLQLKEKLFKWLKSEIDPTTQRPFPPLSPTVWLKLGSRFKYAFKDWSMSNDEAA